MFIIVLSLLLFFKENRAKERSIFDNKSFLSTNQISVDEMPSSICAVVKILFGFQCQYKGRKKRVKENRSRLVYRGLVSGAE